MQEKCIVFFITTIIINYFIGHDSFDPTEEVCIFIFIKILNNLNNSTLVIFSKKGYFVEKVIKNNNSFNLIIFSCSKKVINTCYFRANCTSILTNTFPKNMENFIFNTIKENMNLIFKKNNKALLVFTNFPQKGSRANTLSLIEKKFFL